MCFILVRILCLIWIENLFILCDSKTAFFNKYAILDKKNQTTFTPVPLLQMEGGFVDIILMT